MFLGLCAALGCGRVGFQSHTSPRDAGESGAADAGALDGDVRADAGCDGACPALDAGPCMTDDDCPGTDYCTPLGICATPTCTDGALNQHELRVDCGGECQACVVMSRLTERSPNPASGEYFGDGVAVAGDLLAVAGSGDGWPYTESGTVYVYRGDGSGTHVHEETIVPSLRNARDAFGSAMALEGTRLLVGAWGTNVIGYAAAGRAYVFEQQTDDSWLEVAALDLDQTGGVSAPATDAAFGASVALHGDWALVGAPRESNNGNYGGWVYLFQRQPSPPDTWTFVSRLASAETDLGDFFGASLATDGTWLVVGARARHLPGAGDNTSGGAAYLFEWVGDSWIERQKLQPVTLRTEEEFGDAVALEGNWVAVGAPGTSGTGDTYLYENVGGTWMERGTLVLGDPDSADGFGISLSMDGGRLLVGAPRGGAGAAHVFAHTGDAWTEDAVIRASDAVSTDMLGHYVLLSGSTAFLGAVTDGPAGALQGALYIVPLD